MPLPAYWKSGLDTTETLARTAVKTEAVEIARSAGGRPVWAFCYGERQDVVSRANYNSACGAGDFGSYVAKEGKKPVVMIVGGIHASETEGIMSLHNLISLLESGFDLAGQPYPSLADAAEGVRLVIVPIANPDGRARMTPDAVFGMTRAELEYWAQGTWKDGSLCKWPDCKKVHPITGHVDFLGSYFNDDGINLMHDQFFKPWARETQALMDLAIGEFADFILLLHGGSNSQNMLLNTCYVPVEHNEILKSLAEICHAKSEPALGVKFQIPVVPDKPPTGKDKGAPPSFNLTSALHHATGAVAGLFESNEHIIDMEGQKFTHEQIYRSHFILFEESMRYFT
jgi:hypothetical protein